MTHSANKGRSKRPVSLGTPPAGLTLTMTVDDQTLAAVLQRGVSYLLETVDGDVLAESIVSAMLNQAPISPQMADKLVNACQVLQERAQAERSGEATARPSPATTRKQITPREQQILHEIARGVSNKEIARTFDIAEATVKIHVQNILRKLNLSSRVQAAVYAAAQERGR